jgi:hypothetical protein
MKQRNHTSLDNTKLKRLAAAGLGILAEGLNKHQLQHLLHRNAVKLGGHELKQTENALPWVVKPHNRSPKRMARLKHSLTVLTLVNS